VDPVGDERLVDDGDRADPGEDDREPPVVDHGGDRGGQVRRERQHHVSQVGAERDGAAGGQEAVGDLREGAGAHPLLERRGELADLPHRRGVGDVVLVDDEGVGEGEGRGRVLEERRLEPRQLLREPQVVLVGQGDQVTGSRGDADPERDRRAAPDLAPDEVDGEG